MNRTLEWQSDGTKLIVKCVALRDSIDWPAEWSKSVRLFVGRRNLWRCLIIGTRGPINSGLCESKLARASISARLPALSMCSSGEPVGAVVNYTPVIAQISAICGAILRSRRNARTRARARRSCARKRALKRPSIRCSTDYQSNRLLVERKRGRRGFPLLYPRAVSRISDYLICPRGGVASWMTPGTSGCNLRLRFSVLISPVLNPRFRGHGYVREWEDDVEEVNGLSNLTFSRDGSWQPMEWAGSRSPRKRNVSKRTSFGRRG